MSNKDWDPNLSPEQNYVLRQEGTESPGSSPLNNEKREGSYHCVGCGTKLFDSLTKYESGSGWPSFYKSLPEVFACPMCHVICLFSKLLRIMRNAYHLERKYVVMMIIDKKCN